MNEKRFKLFTVFNSQKKIVDWETGKSCIIEVYDDKLDYFVDLLNNLNDDVKHLEEYSGDLESDVKRLQEENNQLRNTNDYLEIFNSELQVKLGKIMQIVDEADYFKKIKEVLRDE